MGSTAEAHDNPAMADSPQRSGTASLSNSFASIASVSSSQHDYESPRDGNPRFPVSNWAHLQVLKRQRNSLRDELGLQLLANEDINQSAATLRRLSLRLAASVAVKNKKVVDQANSIKGLRKKDYIDGRDQQKKLEQVVSDMLKVEQLSRDIIDEWDLAADRTLRGVYSINSKKKKKTRPKLYVPMTL